MVKHSGHSLVSATQNGAITLRQALDHAIRVLRATSPSPALDAEVLLMHILKRGRAFLRAWPETRLTQDQTDAYEALVVARKTGRPVAYLTGCREFWSREFLVTPDVLIPRPETEVLIERILTLRSQLGSAALLDLATGSGAIAVTLAAEWPEATIYASDVSAAALAVARRNAEHHGVIDRIRFLSSAWFDRIPPDLRFDLIVSNPPYIAASDPHLQQGDVRFEPRLALTAGEDGYQAFRIIAAQAGDRLAPGGRLLLEHGFDQADGVRALLARHGFIAIIHHQDLQGQVRATEAIRPAGNP